MSKQQKLANVQMGGASAWEENMKIGDIYLTGAGCPVEIFKVYEATAVVIYLDEYNSYNYGAGESTTFPRDYLKPFEVSVEQIFVNLLGYIVKAVDIKARHVWVKNVHPKQVEDSHSEIYTVLKRNLYPDRDIWECPLCGSAKPPHFGVCADCAGNQRIVPDCAKLPLEMYTPILIHKKGTRYE